MDYDQDNPIAEGCRWNFDGGDIVHNYCGIPIHTMDNLPTVDDLPVFLSMRRWT